MGGDRTTIGDRMKRQYEVRTQTALPRRTYTLVRLDGKAFHTYTRGLVRPFDVDLSFDMQVAAAKLCEQAMGAQFAYVQSDEISVLLTDFASNQTEAWFDGNVQKIVSVSASIVTARFNQMRGPVPDGKQPAYFDARVFTIPDPTEVENYFIWRQQDCIRNSVAALAQAHFSHKELQGKSGSQMQDMLHEIGINWAYENANFKNGVLVYRRHYVANRGALPVPRSMWTSRPAPVFTQERWALERMIPAYE